MSSTPTAAENVTNSPPSHDALPGNENINEPNTAKQMELKRNFLNKKVIITNGKAIGLTGIVIKIEGRDWWTIDNPSLKGRKVPGRFCKLYDDLPLDLCLKYESLAGIKNLLTLQAKMEELGLRTSSATATNLSLAPVETTSPTKVTVAGSEPFDRSKKRKRSKRVAATRSKRSRLSSALATGSPTSSLVSQKHNMMAPSSTTTTSASNPASSSVNAANANTVLNVPRHDLTRFTNTTTANNDKTYTRSKRRRAITRNTNINNPPSTLLNTPIHAKDEWKFSHKVPGTDIGMTARSRNPNRRTSSSSSSLSPSNRQEDVMFYVPFEPQSFSTPRNTSHPSMKMNNSNDNGNQNRRSSLNKTARSSPPILLHPQKNQLLLPSTSGATTEVLLSCSDDDNDEIHKESHSDENDFTNNGEWSHLSPNMRIDVMNRKTGRILKGNKGILLKDLPMALRDHAEYEPLLPPPRPSPPTQQLSSSMLTSSALSPTSLSNENSTTPTVTPTNNTAGTNPTLPFASSSIQDAKRNLYHGPLNRVHLDAKRNLQEKQSQIQHYQRPREARSSQNTRVSAHITRQSSITKSNMKGRAVMVTGGPYCGMIGIVERYIPRNWYMVSNALEDDDYDDGGLEVVVSAEHLKIIPEHAPSQPKQEDSTKKEEEEDEENVENAIEEEKVTKDDATSQVPISPIIVRKNKDDSNPLKKVSVADVISELMQENKDKDESSASKTTAGIIADDNELKKKKNNEEPEHLTVKDVVMSDADDTMRKRVEAATEMNVSIAKEGAEARMTEMEVSTPGHESKQGGVEKMDLGKEGPTKMHVAIPDNEPKQNANDEKKKELDTTIGMEVSVSGNEAKQNTDDKMEENIDATAGIKACHNESKQNMDDEMKKGAEGTVENEVSVTAGNESKKSDIAAVEKGKEAIKETEISNAGVESKKTDDITAVQSNKVNRIVTDQDLPSEKVQKESGNAKVPINNPAVGLGTPQSNQDKSTENTRSIATKVRVGGDAINESRNSNEVTRSQSNANKTTTTTEDISDKVTKKAESVPLVQNNNAPTPIITEGNSNKTPSKKDKVSDNAPLSEKSNVSNQQTEGKTKSAETSLTGEEKTKSTCNQEQKTNVATEIVSNHDSNVTLQKGSDVEPRGKIDNAGGVSKSIDTKANGDKGLIDSSDSVWIRNIRTKKLSSEKEKPTSNSATEIKQKKSQDEVPRFW